MTVLAGCELQSIYRPIYIALVEYVQASVNIRGNCTIFNFCITEEQSPYIAVQTTADYQHIKEYSSVEDLLTTVYGTSSSPRLHLVSLRYKDGDGAVYCSSRYDIQNSTLRSLLDNQYNLPIDTLTKLNLIQLVTYRSSPSLIQTIQEDLQLDMKKSLEKIDILQKKLRVMKACYAANGDLVPVEPKDNLESKRSCKILVQRLKNKGYPVWDNTIDNWSLLNDQYKIATGKISFSSYCLENVYRLKEKAAFLRFLDNHVIYDEEVKDYITIYYTSTFDRLDFCYSQ